MPCAAGATTVRPAPRTAHRQIQMVLDHRLDHRQLDLLVHPDRLGRQIRRESGPAGRAVVRTMIDDPVRLFAQGSAVTLMARLCTPPGFAFSRFSLRSVAGGFEDVRP